MITELAGFTLARTIPDNVLVGVLSGSYKIFGGVVRNSSGQIIAHLVNNGSSLNMLSAFSSPINTAFSGLNTFQLYRIGSNVGELLNLAKASMLVSGLTLTVSAAGFLFLTKKLNKIDRKLEEIAADIKYVKSFLELQERARLISALKVISNINKIDNYNIKTQMLIHSRQTLGEIHEKYKALIMVNNTPEISIIEEYFTITALGHSLCSAELGLFEQAEKDLSDSYQIWKQSTKSFIKEHIITEKPQRFLTKQYVNHIKLDEVSSWIDFIEDSNVGFDRIDELRGLTSKFEFNLFNTIDKTEELMIGVARKLVERNRVLQGYVDQYKYLSSTKQKPSEIQNFFDDLNDNNKINGCYIFLSNRDM